VVNGTTMSEALTLSLRANLLEAEERVAEAEWLWRVALANGARVSRFATFRLARLLERQGRMAEVEQVWRDAIGRGDMQALVDLASLLEGQGRTAEAETAWRAAAARGQTSAIWRLARLVELQGRAAEADQLFQTAAAYGDRRARSRPRAYRPTLNTGLVAGRSHMSLFGRGP
jgi:hypothetical protein